MRTVLGGYAYSGRRLGFAVAAAFTGCEPRHAPRPDTTVAAAIQGDTQVRRVTRVVRRAAALQRVTGVVHGRAPLEPLDSLLVVRVLDQRGDEIAGATVHWSMRAGEGAALRVANATTDAAGLSRAWFTPGRTADPQIVTADVSRVGHIDFSISVPAAHIAFEPERVTIWSDDDTIVAARLSDASRTYLPGGTVSWTSTDTAALRVQSVDNTHARVLGTLAGRTNVIAWLRDTSVRSSLVVDVRPTLAGRFVTVDGRPPPPMRLEIQAGDVRDSVSVDAGRFRARIELSGKDVDVSAAPVPPSPGVHEVRLRVLAPRQLQHLDIALVPTSWRVDAGTYTGRDVSIDAARALRRAGNTGFWRLVPVSGTAPKKVLGWRDSDLPLRLGFNRARSSEPVTAEDSARFWSIAAQMERDLGARLFVPAEISGEPGAGNLIPIEISAQSSEGHTFVAWTQIGDANDGVVLFRNAATLRDPHVVTHELLHLLGFGHTSAWATVATPNVGREPRLTVEDVAYAQLAMRLRRVQQETGARPGLPHVAP